MMIEVVEPLGHDILNLPAYNDKSENNFMCKLIYYHMKTEANMTFLRNFQILPTMSSAGKFFWFGHKGLKKYFL